MSTTTEGHPIYYLADRSPFLLVGEAPNANMGVDNKWVLCPNRDFATGTAHTANRLMRFTGWPDVGAFHRVFDRTNLLRRCPRAQGSGRAFPLAEAREAGFEAFRAALGYRGVVILGKRAAHAFWWREAPTTPRDVPLRRQPHSRLSYLRWYQLRPHGDATPCCMTPKEATWIPAAVLPHTSATNQWWNDPDNRALATRFFDDLKERAA